MLFALIAVTIMGCGLFIAWRLQRLKAQQAEAEKRAAAAFEEMNKLTKELRDRGKETPADPARPAGERLREMYPGPKRTAS
jgi:cytochrome c-type biogenesis protein CcmH/NrfG